MTTMRGFFVLAVLAMGACFSDAPPLSDDGTTGDGGCAVGSEGCFCTEGGACDAGLECLLPASVCVAEGCMPGAALCECADGSCIDDYECIENVCVPMGSATFSTSDAQETDTSASSTTPITTGTDDTTGTATLDTGTITDATLSDVSTDPTTDSVGSSTGAPPATCEECLMQVQEANCVDEWDACTGCGVLFECFADGMLEQQCCPKGDPIPLNWQAFGTCAQPYCDELCGSLDCVD